MPTLKNIAIILSEAAESLINFRYIKTIKCMNRINRVNDLLFALFFQIVYAAIIETIPKRTLYETNQISTL